MTEEENSNEEPNRKKRGIDCERCGMNTPHAIMGAIPSALFDDFEKVSWSKGAVCTACGALREAPMDEQDMVVAEEEYLDILLEHDLITEEEVKEISK